MAKNNYIKWVIGLSSVLVFTGFVGVTQQQNQDNAAAASSQNSSNPSRHGDQLDNSTDTVTSKPQSDASGSAMDNSDQSIGSSDTNQSQSNDGFTMTEPNQSTDNGGIVNQGRSGRSRQRIRTRAS